MKQLIIFLVTVFSCLIISFALADVITVGYDEGADYTEIQDAIDAATPGDTVSVFSGYYYPFNNLIINKSICVIGETQNSVFINEIEVHITGNGVIFENFVVQSYPGVYAESSF